MNTPSRSTTIAASLNAVPEQTPLAFGWFLEDTQLDDDLRLRWVENRPHLFSTTRLWIDDADLEQMAQSIFAIEQVLANPIYQAAFAHRFALPTVCQPTAVIDTPGVLFGYDFHLTAHGPKLIEINTNAGGALLNACLGDAWKKAVGNRGCAPARQALLDMFQTEWRAASDEISPPPGLLVIVDEAPESQYLFPEFVLCARWLAEQGWQTAIADPATLNWDGHHLTLQGQTVSMVYNRLTDFYLDNPACLSLRLAYEAGAVVLTPAPSAHAKMADKRHLVTLADENFLADSGVDAENRELISRVLPACIPVLPAEAERLWQSRKRFFFKPVAGFGSRATYRGDKLTRRVFDEILQGDYIAQAIALPSERVVQGVDETHTLKVDVRNYTYCGQVLGVVGRLYQGQTTNFRTPGGGFASVYCAPSRFENAN